MPFLSLARLPDGLCSKPAPIPRPRAAPIPRRSRRGPGGGLEAGSQRAAHQQLRRHQHRQVGVVHLNRLPAGFRLRAGATHSCFRREMVCIYIYHMEQR